ncbi:MAG: hypothetical protein L6R19_18880 [Alphaproteobacteria bacterium]|nr:hypothetical protein [Alphaproteobacteria bacterium]
MSTRPIRALAILACAAAAALPALAQTPEDVRHEADLRACAQIADERQRNECVARVQAQIREERIRRVESVFRGRQSN